MSPQTSNRNLIHVGRSTLSSETTPLGKVLLLRENPRKNPIICEYILPDYSANRPGRIRKKDEPLQDSWQIMFMENERFSVPEVLFRPDDIGMYHVLSDLYDYSLMIFPLPLRSSTIRSCQRNCSKHRSSSRRLAGYVLGEHRLDRWNHQIPRVP